MSLKKQGKYRFQNFEVDLADRSLRRDGNTIAVSSRTFDLLVFLILNPQRVVTKDELLDALWPGSYAEESNLSQHIFLLRKALTGKQSGDKLLATVPGRGYQFATPVTVVAKPDGEVHTPRTERSRLEQSRLEQSGLERSKATPLFQSIEQIAEPADRISMRKRIDYDDYDDLLSPSRSRSSRFFAGFRHPGPWHVMIFTAIVAILGFGSYFGWKWKYGPKPESMTMVIASLQNTTSNPQFDEAIGTALSIDLQQSPFLIVASPAKIAQTLNEMDETSSAASADRPLTPELARQVCSHLNDKAYLTGDVRRFVMKYMVSLQAFDCASGRKLAGSKGIADTPDGIVAVLDKVAVDLRKQLGGESSGSVDRFSKPLFAGRGASLEALKDYSDATHLESSGKLVESVTLFQHAVEIDPLFAPAFAELGKVYSDLGEHDLASAALTRAYELRDSVDEPDRLFIISAYNDNVTGDIQAAIHNYQAWTAEYPRNPAPLVDLAKLENEIGEPALALDPARRSMQLNQAIPEPYVALARAQLNLGQFEEAAKTCQLALRRGIDDAQIHSLLMQTAFLRLDQPGMDAQVAWAKDRPAEPLIQSQLGLIDFAQGKVRTAQVIVANALDGYRKQGQTGLADQVSATLPRIEAELGLTGAAYGQLARLPETAEFSDIPVAWAEVGDVARAEAAAKRALDAHPTDTLWQEYRVPQIRAAVALTRGQPAVAVDALTSATSFDLRAFDTPSMRGRAFLAAHQPQLAEAEFHKVLDHPGIQPYSHDYPLAQLGLARALAQEGKMVEAGFAYKLVLQIWKDADPDLPPFREAKAEYARLTAEIARNSSTAALHAAHKPPVGKRPGI